jgi:hypothetical protein
MNSDEMVVVLFLAGRRGSERSLGLADVDTRKERIGIARKGPKASASVFRAPLAHNCSRVSIFASFHVYVVYSAVLTRSFRSIMICGKAAACGADLETAMIQSLQPLHQPPVGLFLLSS